MELLKKISFFLFTAFILFLFIWALFIPKGEISHKIAEVIKTQSERADMAFRGVTVSEVVDGIKYWEIKAKASDINEDQSLAILKDTDGTFFEKGQPGLKFISPEILWQMNDKEIEMKRPFGFDVGSEKKARETLKDPQKNIFSLPFKNGRGYYFKAEKLKWRLKDKKIFCAGDIWIRKGNVIGKAETLQSDVKLEDVTLGGNPFMVIGSPQLVTIEAEYFEVNSIKDTILAKNNVTIANNDKKAFGDNGIYDIKKGQLSLTGNVRLKQGESYLTGEIISYIVKEGRFKLSGKSRAIISEKSLKEN